MTYKLCFWLSGICFLLFWMVLGLAHERTTAHFWAMVIAVLTLVFVVAGILLRHPRRLSPGNSSSIQ